MSYLYILSINLLSKISFANIFSSSVECLFILLMVSFAIPKLFHLMWSHLFIFAFVALALGGRSKKILVMPVSKSTLSMSFWRSFMVSGLTFKSLIHFESIFTYFTREKVVQFHSFACSCPVFPISLIEETLSS